MAKVIAAENHAAQKFSKEQLIRSTRFAGRRDLLGALLKEDKRYSVEEAETAIEHYMKGKVT